MQRALPGSVLVHAAVLAIALVGFSWPEPDDAPAAEVVSVNIISMSSVSANATAVVQNDSTVDLVSSGVTGAASTITPIEPETVEPIITPVMPVPPEPPTPRSEPSLEPSPVETVEPVAPEAPKPTAIETREPLEAAPQDPVAVEPTTEIALLASSAVNSLASQAVAAATPPTLEPVNSAELKTAPVPQTLSFQRPSEPTAPKPAPTPPKPRTPAPQPSQTGNGGTNTADAVASAGSTAQQAANGNGGDAEVARYPSDVLRKLRRALRSTNGPRGEVIVRFTVLADGRLSGVSIGRSSGNAIVDQAGLATVSRAAPFPPIPAGANRSNWTFDVPLAFGG